MGVRCVGRTEIPKPRPPHRKKGVDTMAFFQLPSGNFGYYNSKYGSYSPEHGWVYNNQREETELVNSIVDDKLAEYSRRAEAELE